MTTLRKRGGRVTKAVARERERRAWELKNQLWTNQRIADEMGLEKSTIVKILRRVVDRVKKETNEVSATYRNHQIEQLQRIADEAMQAWERSKESEKTVTSIKPDGGVETKVVKMKDADGDPRYLTTAMNALTDLRKIIGLDAPARTQLDIADTTEARLTDEERLQRLQQILDIAKDRKREKEREESRKVPDQKPAPIVVLEEKAEIIQ